MWFGRRRTEGRKFRWKVSSPHALHRYTLSSSSSLSTQVSSEHNNDIHTRFDDGAPLSYTTLNTDLPWQSVLAATAFFPRPTVHCPASHRSPCCIDSIRVCVAANCFQTRVWFFINARLRLCRHNRLGTILDEFRLAAKIMEFEKHYVFYWNIVG